MEGTVSRSLSESKVCFKMCSGFTTSWDLSYGVDSCLVCKESMFPFDVSRCLSQSL